MRTAACWLLFLVLCAAACSASGAVTISESVRPVSSAQAPVVEPPQKQTPLESTAIPLRIRPTPEPTATPIPADATEPTVSTSLSRSATTDSPILELFDVAPYPYDSERLFVQATDYRRAFDQAGYELSELCDDDSPEYVEAAQDARMSVGLELLIFPRSPLSEAYEDMNRSLGFGHCQLDASLEIEAPTAYVSGEFDPAASVAAARADDRWADILVVEERDDRAVLRWDFDPYVGGRTASPMFRGGFPMEFEVSNDIVVQLPPSDNSGLRLGEVGTMRETAAALLAEGAHAIMVTDRPFLPFSDGLLEVASSGANPQEAFEVLEEELAVPMSGLAPWTSIGYGIGAPDGDIVGVIVASSVSEDAAIESAERFPLLVENGGSWARNTPWRELIRVREVRVEGNLMIATVESLDPDDWIATILIQALGGHEELFAIGETAE